MKSIYAIKMTPFLKTFEVRWSDLDANRHLANTTYSEYMVHTRMSFFKTHGFTQQSFVKHQIGPAVLHEEFFYLKEISPDDTVYVDLELCGRSADFRFMQLSHSLFRSDKHMAAYSKATICWMDLEKRKITPPPIGLAELIDQMPKAESYHILNKEDTMKQHLIPIRMLAI